MRHTPYANYLGMLLAHGAWRMTHDAWRMAHDAWRMAHGA